MMIHHIFQDSVYFLGLALIVMCGFALALYFLFRHVTSDYPRPFLTSSELNLTNFETAINMEETKEKARDAFGGFLKSVETLFFALLADFERDVSLSVSLGSLLRPLSSRSIVRMTNWVGSLSQHSSPI